MKNPVIARLKTLFLYFMRRHYRAAYRISRLLSVCVRASVSDENRPDLVFVVLDKGRGWILEAIAKEVAQRFAGRYSFHYELARLPDAKAYFFLHYANAAHALKMNPILWRRKVFVFYTHPRDDLGVSDDDVLYALNHVTTTFCMCTDSVSMLRENGVAPERLACVVGGADPAFFVPHERGGGKVGFSSAYYARKSPDRILQIVRSMPHRQFLLIGRRWKEYSRFEEMYALPNFEYVETPYQGYPALYATVDVFVSPAKLEGGPIPLLEAMMANAVPVASRTGFAPDIIQHGENGYLFDVDAPVEEICTLIERAFALEGDVRSTVLRCSWDHFALDILSRMQLGTEDSSIAVSRKVMQEAGE